MATELANNALTTIAAVKSELAVECDDTDRDDYIARLINSVSTSIERYLSRELRYEAGRVESVPGYGGVRIRVKKAPVVTLTSVVVQYGAGLTDPITVSEVIVEDEGRTGLLFREYGWVNTVRGRAAGIAQDLLPGAEEPSIVITFDGGFVLPQQAADDETNTLVRSLPYDIEDAAILAVTSRVLRRGDDHGIKSERLLSHSVTYDVDKKTGLPHQTLAMVAPYKRPAFSAS